MANLIATTPAQGLLPKTVGAVTLTEVVPDRITAVMPLKGKEKAVNAAMKETLGVGFPAPGRMLPKGAVRALWVGKGEALVMGADCPALDGAACVDQSDAWCIVEIAGQGVEDVLARLVPLDLRAGSFKKGHTARTLAGHMTASVTRTAANSFEIMVFRSMAGTLIEELSHAATQVAARG